MGKQDYTDVLLEDMSAKFDILIEGFGQIRNEVKTLATQSSLDEVKADVKVIKAAVTDLSAHVNDHEERLTATETI